MQWQEVKIDGLALRRWFLKILKHDVGPIDPWQEDEFMQRTERGWPVRDNAAQEEDG